MKIKSTTFVKITPELAKEFKEKYNASLEPIFRISNRFEVTHGCKVIERTEKAVFVLVNSFLWCGGFWMPIETYNTMKDGYIVEKGLKTPINYNSTTYIY